MNILVKKIPLVVAFLSLLTAVGLSAQIPVEMTRQFWRDPGFVERFLGTYGTIANSEPRLKQEERTVMQELSALIQNNPMEAIKLLNKTITSESSATLVFIRGNLYFQQGDLNRAASDYSEAIRIFANFQRAHKNLGLIRLQQEDHAGAAASLGRAVELGESDGRTFGLLGYSYFTLENYIAAENSYRQALMLDPGNKDWTVGLSQALMALGEFSSAGSLMEMLLKEDPGQKQYWLFLVNVNLNLEQSEMAAEILEILRLRGQATQDNLQLLGNIYLNQEDFGLALNAFKEMLARTDALPDANVLVETASILIRYNANDEAKVLLERIESSYGSSLEREQRLHVWTLLAQIARAEFKGELAAQLLNKILEEAPANGGALLELARYHADTGELEKAFLLIDRAGRLMDYEAQAFRLKGQFLVRERKYDQAADALERSYRLTPEDHRLRDYLAEVKRAASLAR